MLAHSLTMLTLSTAHTRHTSEQALPQSNQSKSVEPEPSTANAHLISLFEDALMNQLQPKVAERIEFEDTLLIDMRGGMFAAAVVSLDTDQRFKRTPRAIQVEIAESVSPAETRTPLCVYNQKGSKAWVACSTQRLIEKAQDAAVQIVENIFTEAEKPSEDGRNTAFVRMCFAFLGDFRAISIEYERVMIVIDQPNAAVLIKNALPSLSKLMGDQQGRWLAAHVQMADPQRSLLGYAFFDDPAQPLETDQCFLILYGSQDAIDLTNNGFSFSVQRLSAIDAVEHYTKIAVIGSVQPTRDSRLIYFQDRQQLEDAALVGYLQWTAQLVHQLPTLRAQQTQIQNALAELQVQNLGLRSMVDRLRAIVAQLSM